MSFVATWTNFPASEVQPSFDDPTTKPWDMPWGLLAINTRTTDAGPTAAEADISGLDALSLTTVANRRIRLALSFRGIVYTVATDTAGIRIKEGGTTLQEYQGSEVDNTVGDGGSPFVVISPTEGPHTYKISLLRTAGTGNITLQAAATYPATFIAEDLGPVR